MACTACLVCFISTVNGHRNKKKKRKEESYPRKASTGSGHTTNLKQFISRLPISMAYTYTFYCCPYLSKDCQICAFYFTKILSSQQKIIPFYDNIGQDD